MDRPIITNVDFKERPLDDPEVRRRQKQRFGEQGWDIFLKYFEYISRIVITLLERHEQERNRYPIKWTSTRQLFHFLLNPLGLPSFDGDGELSAHTDALLERISSIVEYQARSEGISREQVIEKLLGTIIVMENEQLGLRIKVVCERI